MASHNAIITRVAREKLNPYGLVQKDKPQTWPEITGDAILYSNKKKRKIEIFLCSKIRSNRSPRSNASYIRGIPCQSIQTIYPDR